jgi:hypothetical protein
LRHDQDSDVGQTGPLARFESFNLTQSPVASYLNRRVSSLCSAQKRPDGIGSPCYSINIDDISELAHVERSRRKLHVDILLPMYTDLGYNGYLQPATG